MIQGIQKTTLVDFAPFIATTIFLGGCNFRCPFCHNPELVKTPKTSTISEQEVLDFLNSRAGKIDGVCISGGEPTIHQSLLGLLRKIRSLGLKIKLDTNASNPQMVDRIINQDLVDYIAIDIKSCKHNYPRAAGVSIDPVLVRKTVELIRESGMDHELRTTAVPEFISEDLAMHIGAWLGGESIYYLQRFQTNKLLDPSMSKVTYSDLQLEDIRVALSSYFPQVQIR